MRSSDTAITMLSGDNSTIKTRLDFYVSGGLFLFSSNFQYWQMPSMITQLSGTCVLTLNRGSRVDRSNVIGPFKQFKDRNTCLKWESAVSRGSITDNQQSITNQFKSTKRTLKALLDCRDSELLDNDLNCLRNQRPWAFIGHFFDQFCHKSRKNPTAHTVKYDRCQLRSMKREGLLTAYVISL